MASPFMNGCEIEFYDSQFLETLFDASGDPEILKNFSYSENFLPMLPMERFSGCNCFIFIYNFNYEGTVSGISCFAFIGTFDYR